MRSSLLKIFIKILMRILKLIFCFFSGKLKVPNQHYIERKFFQIPCILLNLTKVVCENQKISQLVQL